MRQRYAAWPLGLKALLWIVVVWVLALRWIGPSTEPATLLIAR